MFTFVVAKLIFGNLKVLISGSELGLSVTAKKVIPPLHVTLVRLIELSLLKNRSDTWFLISSDILVSIDAN